MKTITLKTIKQFAGFAGICLFALMFMSLTPQSVQAQDRPMGGRSNKTVKAGKKSVSKKKPRQTQDDELLQRPKVGKAVKFDISPPLSLMKPILTVDEEEKGEDDRGEPGPINDTRHDPDPVVQQLMGDGVFSNQLDVPGTNANFEGMLNTQGVNPPDPNGDIGLNHYVQMVNSRFQIFNRTGTSVYGPANINTIFAGFGGACQNENAGDPIVIYDQLADRWLLSQFTAAGPTYFNCVAVSTTGDPTGTYYRYAFSTGSNFPDYPKYGVWSNAYFISTREFAGGNSFAGVGAYALNRAQMLAGNPAPQVVSFIIPPGSQAFRIGDGLLPADLDGTRLPPAGSPHYFLGSMDAGATYGAPADALNLFKFNVDWAVPANSTFTFANQLNIAAFDTIFPCPSGRSCIPQPGTAVGIDILSYRQRPTFRLAYRNFGTHESLVTTQSVEATTGVAGMRWWEIRSPNSNPIIYQEGTYAPDSVNRWMGSIAMDADGNMALGYSVSDATSVFPGIRYTGRLATDPLGMLPQGEGTIINGGGSQTGGGNRWGDYTSMSVDPRDDCTFWYTNEYYAATSANTWNTRIASFKFPNCSVQPINLSGITIVSESNSPANNTPDPGETVTVSVELKNHESTASNNVTATLQNSGGITPVAPTTQSYGVIAAGATVIRNFTFSVPANAPRGSVVTLTFQVQDGATNYTFIHNYTLGNSIIVNNGVNIVSESNIPANNTPDPGETLSVSLPLQNTGNLVSNAVTATLQNTGGITPTAPATQNYGAIAAGGVVTRNFTFSVPGNAACGSSITLTFQVQDGAISYTFTKTYALGARAILNSENFDGVTAPALPANWTSTLSGSGTGWTTSTTTPASAPNAAFAGEPATVGLSELESPVWNVNASTARLDFKINYNTEATYDGAVLEIKIGAGAYQDIVAAGGSFVSGSYNATIFNGSGADNPLKGRAAWTGNSNGYVSSSVNLPAAAAGQTVQFRWRMGTDTGVGGQGIYLDDIQLLGAYVCAVVPVALTVTKTADTNNASCAAGDCSLREALKVAGSDGFANVINFDIPANSAGCVGANCTITLSSPLAPLADGGLLTLIDGTAGANRITLSGNGATRILTVGSGVNLAFDNLNFTRGNGVCSASGCASTNGGAIFNTGTLALTNSALYNNSTSSGGAIYNQTGGALTLTNVTISGNTAGGGIGGGIFGAASVTATNCTITGNTGQFTGGVSLPNASSSFTVRNTIIAGNTSSFSPDAQGNFTSQGYNLVGNASGATGFTQTGDQTGTTAASLNARLAPLASNGGKTLTHALMSGSPAIDKGGSSALTTDQRGFLRLIDLPSIINATGGNGSDIGAFEVQGLIYEGDVAGRPNGSGDIQSNDVVQMLRFLNELDAPATSSTEFQRADAAPRAAGGDGSISSADVIQTVRYLNELDALQLIGGPTAPNGSKPSGVEEFAAGGFSDGLMRKGIGKVSTPQVAPELRVENASGSAGNPVTVNIRVDAVGNESQYAFAVLFDPAVLTFSSFAAGETGAADFSCNTTATPGRVRCSVGAFPTNNPMSNNATIKEINAGNNQLLIKVIFNVAANAMANSTTAISIGSQTAADDLAASIIPAATGGTVSITGTTAAGVSVTGRVIVGSRGLSNAVVTLTDSNGTTRTARTNLSGYFTFAGVEVGRIYIIQTTSKLYRFQPQTISITEEISDLLITPEKQMTNFRLLPPDAEAGKGQNTPGKLTPK